MHALATAAHSVGQMLTQTHTQTPPRAPPEGQVAVTAALDAKSPYSAPPPVMFSPTVFPMREVATASTTAPPQMVMDSTILNMLIQQQLQRDEQRRQHQQQQMQILLTFQQICAPVAPLPLGLPDLAFHPPAPHPDLAFHPLPPVAFFPHV